MIAFYRQDFFSLSESGVRCGEDGLFVGSVALLRRASPSGDRQAWSARPVEELDRELTDLYGWPIDIGVKRAGLASIARALDRGDLVFAKVSALLLRLPDPPSLAKGTPTCGAPELAARLFNSGLLKGGWDPAEHPRTEEPPNRGWFAPSEKEPEPKGELEPAKPKGELEPTDPKSEPELTEPKGESEPTGPTGSKRDLFGALRAMLKGIAVAVEAGEFALWAASEIRDRMQEFAVIWKLSSPTTLLQIGMRATQQARASLDPPKTLVELQTPPTDNPLGYQLHHIVEQNPDNLEKSPEEIRIEKFGRNLIDSPSNLVWVPRLKHELVTGYYNSIDVDDLRRRLHRRVVNEGDFDAQREAGLEALRRFGVLK